MSKKQLLFFVLVTSIVFASCTKRQINNAPLESNWLLPLVKGQISLNDLTRLEGKSYTYAITANDIGMPSNSTVSSPALHIDNIGPFVVPTQEIIHHLKVDSLEVGIELENLFPVNIDAGFTITLRSSNDTTISSNIVFTKTFGSILNQNTKDSLPLSITNATLADSLYFYVENVDIDAFTNVVFDKDMPITISLNKVRLNELGLYSNKMFEMKDTVSFESGDLSNIYNNGNISDSSVTGFINIFTDNGLPIFTNMQLLFLNNGIKKDSVFENSFLMNGALVNANGLPTNIQSQKNTVAISKAKLKNIEQSNQLIYSFAINTNGYTTPYVVITKQNVLALQLVSDLKLILNPFQF